MAQYVFTTGKSWVQRLDTVIANISTVSLNFWLIKLVKEQSLIFCNSKFIYFERTLNIHPPFVVSFAVQIIKSPCALETTDDFWLKIKIRRFLSSK